MKSIIFFDGDGTLWYPKTTKRTVKPHWVYTDPKTASDYLSHIVLTPTTRETLEELKSRGKYLVLLSTHPHEPEEAHRLLIQKVEHFGLDLLFDEIHAARHYIASKGEIMCKVLEQKGIAKEYALMVGDTYEWDYKTARDFGIDAVLIESAYRQEHEEAKQVSQEISELQEVLRFL